MKRKCLLFVSLLLTLSLLLGILPAAAFENTNETTNDQITAETVLDENVSEPAVVAVPEEKVEKDTNEAGNGVGDQADSQQPSVTEPAGDAAAAVSDVKAEDTVSDVKAEDADSNAKAETPVAQAKAGAATRSVPSDDPDANVQKDAPAATDTKDSGDGKDGENKDAPVLVSFGIKTYEKEYPYDGTEKTYGPNVTFDGTDKMYEVVVFKEGDKEPDAELTAELAQYVTVTEMAKDANGAPTGVVLKRTNAGTSSFTVVGKVTGELPAGYKLAGENEFKNNVKLTITPKPITVHFSGKITEITFDGQRHDYGWEFTTDEPGFTNKDFAINMGTAEIMPRNVDTHTHTVVSGDLSICNPDKKDNYDPTFIIDQAEVTLKINPAPITLTTKSARKMVDGTPLTCHELTGGAFYGKNDGIDSSRLEEEKYIRWVGSQTEIGECENKVTDADGGIEGLTYCLTDSCWSGGSRGNGNCNYKIVAVNYGTLTVFDKNAVQIQVYGPVKSDALYTGEEQTFEASAADLKYDIDNKDYEAIFKNDPDNSVTCSQETFTVKGTDAGTYKADLTPSMFTNHIEGYTVTFVIAEDVSLVINPYPVQADIYANRQTVGYDGKEHSIPSYTLKLTYLNKEIQPKVEYAESDLIYHGDDATLTGTEEGVYSTTLSGDEGSFENVNPNFEVNWILKTKSAYLQITRPVVTLFVQGASFTRPYDGKDHTLSVSKDGSTVYLDGEAQDCPLYEVVKVDNPANAAFDPSKIYYRATDEELSVTAYGVPSEPVTIADWVQRMSYSGDECVVQYEIMQPVSLAITKVPITMTINDLTVYYGDEIVPTATYGGIPEDTPEEERPSFKAQYINASGVTELADPLPVGTYTIKWHVIGLGSAFELDVENDITNGTLTVLPRPVTVNVTGKQIAYAHTGKEISVYRAFSVAFEDELYKSSYVTEKKNAFSDPLVSGTEIGDYPFGYTPASFENTNANFAVTFNVAEDGMLKIVDAKEYKPITVTLKGNTEKIFYDGEEHPDATMTVNKPEDYDFEAAITYTPAGGHPMAAPRNAGSYALGLKLGWIKDKDGVDLSNLYFINNKPIDGMLTVTTETPATLDIEKQPITVEISGNRKIMKVKDLPFGGYSESVEGFTIEVTNNIAHEKYAYSVDDIQCAKTAKASITRQQYNSASTKPVTKHMGLTVDDFTNKNSNYDVTFKLKTDGWIRVYANDDATVHRPDLLFTYKSATYVYDGKEHVLEKGYVEEVGKEGNYTVCEVTEEETGNKYTVKFVPLGKKDPLKRKNVGTSSYGDYGISSNHFVYDENGVDVTKMVNSMKVREGENDPKAQLVITPGTITVTIRTDITKVYGEKDPDPQTWVEVVGDVPEGFNPIFELDVYRDPGEDVGLYEIHARYNPRLYAEEAVGSEIGTVEDYEEYVHYQDDLKKAAKGGSAEQEQVQEQEQGSSTAAAESQADNYDVVITNQTPAYLEITPAPLTISVGDYLKDYGIMDPTFTVTITGLIGSEYLPAGAYTMERKPGELIGQYPIVLTYYPKDGDELPPLDKPLDPIPDAPDPDNPVTPELPGEQEENEEIVKDYLEEAYKEEVYKAPAKREIAAEQRADAIEAVAAEQADFLTAVEKEKVEEEVGEQPYPFNPGVIVIEDIVEDEQLANRVGSGVFKSKNYTVTLDDGTITIVGIARYHLNPPVDGEDDETVDDDMTNVYAVLDSDTLGFTEDGILEIGEQKFEFIGWNTKADGSGDSYDAEDEYTVDDEPELKAALRAEEEKDPILELYAQWKEVEEELTEEPTTEEPTTEEPTEKPTEKATEEETTEKSESTSPRTGDFSNPFLWMGICMVALIAIAIVAIRLRKKED